MLNLMCATVRRCTPVAPYLAPACLPHAKAWGTYYWCSTCYLQRLYGAALLNQMVASFPSPPPCRHHHRSKNAQYVRGLAREVVRHRQKEAVGRPWWYMQLCSGAVPARAKGEAGGPAVPPHGGRSFPDAALVPAWRLSSVQTVRREELDPRLEARGCERHRGW